MNQTIGDLIDKLSIINIKIWDATQKAHESKEKKTINDFLMKIEIMNSQRREYIQAINNFFGDKNDALNEKTFFQRNK